MKRSTWFEGLLYAESLVLEGYSCVLSNGEAVFTKDGSGTLKLFRYNSQFQKDTYFQGILDYLENRYETSQHENKERYTYTLQLILLEALHIL